MVRLEQYHRIFETGAYPKKQQALAYPVFPAPFNRRYRNGCALCGHVAGFVCSTVPRRRNVGRFYRWSNHEVSFLLLSCFRARQGCDRHSAPFYPGAWTADARQCRIANGFSFNEPAGVAIADIYDGIAHYI